MGQRVTEGNQSNDGAVHAPTDSSGKPGKFLEKSQRTKKTFPK
ncbi:hypothetical protein TNCT_462381, partial [Trichonephila clavata]